MKLPAILPDAFLRCIEPAERKRIAVGQLTAEEALSKAEIRNERDLQKQILALLRLHGIEPLCPTFGKKTRMAVGWPDVTFAVHAVWEQKTSPGYSITDSGLMPCAWELKHNGKLSKEQEQMHVRLSTPPNAWRIKIIRSVQEAVEELRELGIVSKSKGKYWLADTIALSVNRGPLTDILIQVEILSRALDPAPDCVETGFASVTESVGEFRNGQSIQLTPEEDREALDLYAKEYRRQSQLIEE